MAEKDIGLTLQVKLDESKKDLEKIQQAGGFSGKTGAKNLNKVQSFLEQLEKLDFSKLDSKSQREALNTLGKIRSVLDSAAQGLSTYSKAFLDQQEKVHKANVKLTKSQDKQTEALEKQAEVYKKLKESSATFYNKQTGMKVTKPETIADLYEKNQLDIRAKDKQTPLTGAARATVEGKIKDVINADKAVEAAKVEVETANATLKAEKITLEGIPQGGELHPVTREVTSHSEQTSSFIASSKGALNSQQASSNASFEIDTTTKALEKQTSSLGKAFRTFSLYAIALRTAKKALNEVKVTIRDLDKYLTEQAMVTGKTRKETYALLNSYQEMASQLGATTKEVASVATQFMRQGKTTADTLVLTRAAISAAKVASIDVTESVNYLTTALNGFQLSAENAMKVSDKFASIAAQSATSYEELAIALSKVAAQANMAGMSIDYTTALLAKGIETTREAPETIGTALKTVVARMRELTDYGATLEDGMNINNVETQLEYVGIALRNENGELRSTEDVLNDLGRKWDELSSNQQAALAKALAGTRQQSRLIAMMSDYERVTELQEIAQRSAGATAAQAAVYMEGMEAALNKVNVAWEKIISSITDSDVIINIIERVSIALDKFGDFLSNTAGMIATMTTLSVIGLVIIGNKMREHRINKQIQQVQLLQNIQEAKKRTLEQKGIVLSKQKAVEEKKISLEKARQLSHDSSLSAAERAAAKADADRYEQELVQAKSELLLEEKKLTICQEQEEVMTAQTSLVGKIGSGLMGLTGPLFMILTLWKTISGMITVVRAKQAAHHKKTMSEAIAENSVNATGAAGKIISNLGVWGIPIAIAVAAALAGIALAIGAGITSASKDATTQAAKDVNTLSNEIYKLTERANAIKNIESQYEALDNKIIKTAEDQKKMNELLDSAADKLDEEQKKTYEALATDKQRYQYLQQIERESKNKADDLRKQQIEKIRSLRPEDRAKLLSSNATDAEILEAQSAIYAINNSALYDYIDSIGGAQEGVEKLTQSILENMSAEEAWKYANDDSKQGIKALTNAINALSITTSKGDIASAAKVLSSDSYKFSERIEAFRQLEEQIRSTGDSAAIAAFSSAYSEWATLTETFNGRAIEFIDNLGISIDKINDLATAVQSLGYNSEESAEYVNALFDAIESGKDLGLSIMDIFGIDQSSSEYKTIIQALEKAIGTGALNMGQNIKSLKSQINSFYETVSKWNTLSDVEKTEFLSDNYALFQGEGGQELYNAFQTGDYNVIQNALANNEALQNQVSLRIKQIETDLQIELAKAEGDRNQAYIEYLKQQKAYLEDTENLYRASLEMRLEQEQNQLKEYKSYLQAQQDALVDSLNKRKDAYQKYFDAINEQREEEEYEEKAGTLISNIAKLSTSENASSKQKEKELTQQLEELEKERLDTLRQQAQEKVISNLDDTVSQINEKFDKLLENNQALLQAMTGDLEDPASFAANVLSNNLKNMTATEAENYLRNDFATAYGSVLPSDLLNNIEVTGNGDNLILNINGKEIEIGESSQQDLYLLIMNALKQQGLR